MASNVNILIRAKDQATATMSKVGSQAGTLSGQLKGMIGPIAAIGAAYLSWKGITTILSSSISAFTVQEKAVLDLSKTLGIFGDEVKGNMADLQIFAGELQMLTNVGDEVSLGLMKQARLMGVGTDQLKGMTQASIALSEVTGKGLSTSLQTLTKAREGDYETLQRTFPQLKKMVTESEKQAFINDMLSKSFKVASNGPKDMEGALQSMGNNWGDIMETIGGLMLPFFTNLADWFNRIAPLIQTSISSAIPVFQALAASAESAFQFVFDKGIWAFTALETVFSSVGDSIALVWTTIELAGLNWFENTKHLFTVQLPVIVKWLTENWANLFIDLFNFVKTALVNAVTAYINIFTKFWEWVASGFEGGIEKISRSVGDELGKNLLEGFEATTSQLPEMIARSLTDGENELANRAGDLAVGMATKFDEKLKARRGLFSALFSGELGQGATQFAGLQFGSASSSGSNGGGTSSALAGKESRLLTGRSNDPQKLIEANTKRLAEVTEENSVVLGAMSQFLSTIAANTLTSWPIKVVGS